MSQMYRNAPAFPLSERYLDKATEGLIAATSSSEDTLENLNAGGRSTGPVEDGPILVEDGPG